MADREKLIELLKTACPKDKVCDKPCVECTADYLIANGVTIVEDHTGETVFALFDVSEYVLKSGKVKERKTQICSFRHLRSALRFGNVEVREKVCTNTDSGRIGNIVFLTREEAEAVVNRYRKE